MSTGLELGSGSGRAGGLPVGDRRSRRRRRHQELRLPAARRRAQEEARLEGGHSGVVWLNQTFHCNGVQRGQEEHLMNQVKVYRKISLLTKGGNLDAKQPCLLCDQRSAGQSDNAAYLYHRCVHVDGRSEA
ncbi:uncharacterized protein LOC127762625 [Oryza glaberrima]|uniref:uncharacterized protein LOC127762625 n=1 Tax=Oryza glaberrima TaxID=4538 RepID=UPI00224C5C22|nr:uncharacterized protein LOC127762625 [Oryza glaberrima]